MALQMEPGRQVYPGSVYTLFRDGGRLVGLAEGQPYPDSSSPLQDSSTPLHDSSTSLADSIIERSESFIHVEVDALGDPSLVANLTLDVRRVLDDVRRAVDDWPAMLAKVGEVVTAIESRTNLADASERAEVAALLRWMAEAEPDSGG